VGFIPQVYITRQLSNCVIEGFSLSGLGAFQGSLLVFAVRE